MRGLLKAAALLSSTLTSAFVIPNSKALDVRPADDIIEYREHPEVKPLITAISC